MNTIYLEHMRETLTHMLDAMEPVDGQGQATRTARLDMARTLSRMSNSFALASIAESLTQIAGRADCLAGIEESLNDIVGSVVAVDIFPPDNE